MKLYICDDCDKEFQVDDRTVMNKCDACKGITWLYIPHENKKVIR